MIFLIVIHVIACVGLIFFVLIQSGKGGGLLEGLSSAESLFGTKTNTFLARATTGLAVTFFITCLLLAFSSVQQNKSIITKQALKQPKKTENTPKTEKPTEPAQSQAPQTNTQIPQEQAEKNQVAETSQQKEINQQPNNTNQQPIAAEKNAASNQ